MLGQQFILKQVPQGILADGDVELVTRELPSVLTGEVKVKTMLWGVDLGLRMRLTGVTTYAPPLPVGAKISGFTVGEIIETNDPRFVVGDEVTGAWGWCDYAVVAGDAIRPAPARGALPLTSLLGTMGVPGITTYFGMLDVRALKAGETVFVTSAAGGVGTISSQIAKIKGARVIGLAGGPAKCEWLTQTLGLDGTIDYKASTDLDTQLSEQFPDGIDVVFENIGNRMVDAVLPHMRDRGRIAICGQTEDYNATPDTLHGIKNTVHMIGSRVRMEGFVALDYVERYEEARADLRAWSSEGLLTTQEHVTVGLTNLPEAFRSLFTTNLLGRKLVAADASV